MIRRCFVAVMQYLRNAPSVIAPEIDSSIRDEIDFHLNESTDDHVKGGMTIAAARRAALDQFGDVNCVVKECRAESSVDQAICHRLHMLTTALVVAVVLLVVLRPAAPVAVPLVAATELQADQTNSTVTGDIRGQVLDENAHPIGQANILAVVKTWPANGYRQQAYTATTNADGEFTIDDVYPVGQEYHIQIATVADNRLLRSTYIRSEGEQLDPVVFQLPATEAFALRIEGVDGESVVGAEVFPHRRIDSSGEDHLVYFDCADPIIRRSNDDGVVKLPYFVAGDKATIYLRLPDREWHTREVVVPRDGNVVLKTESGDKTGEQTALLVSIVKNGFALESVYVLNKDGKELKPLEFKMTAAKPLTVQLVDKKGKPLAKTAVAPRDRRTPDGDEYGLYYQSLRSVVVMTDAEGKVEMGYFRVGDEADIEVFAAGDGTKATFQVKDEDERRITVDIKQRFDLIGSVLTNDGESVAKATVLLIFKSWPNNRYRQLPLVTKTDEHGKFRFPRLYSEGDRTAFLVTIVEDGFAMESQYVVNQNGGRQDFQFKLSDAEKLEVQFVDEKGRPLANASIFPRQRKTAGGDEYLVYHQSGRSITQRTDANGKLELDLFAAGDTVELAVMHAGKSSTVSFKVGTADEQVVQVSADADQSRNRRWQPKPRKAAAEQIAWIRKSAIPLKSTDPANEDFSDLAPLKKLIGNAHIVQLGEQSHGDGTCFETKTRLIKFLHQEMGFDVLAFESGLFDCRKAWQAFRAGRPTSEAANQGIFGIWTGSRQVQPLLKYLASRANSDRPLELCGFDSQFTAAGSREHLVKDLRRLIDELQIEAPSEKALQAPSHRPGIGYRG